MKDKELREKIERELLHTFDSGVFNHSEDVPTALTNIMQLIRSRESQLFKEIEERVIGDTEIESIWDTLSPDDYMVHGANEKIQEQRQRLAQLRKEWGE